MDEREEEMQELRPSGRLHALDVEIVLQSALWQARSLTNAALAEQDPG